MTFLSRFYHGGLYTGYAPAAWTQDKDRPMTTALATQPTDALAVTADQLDLIRRTIAKDATPDELKLYLFDCHRQGVHPLDKLIHFTKRSGKYTPITSIDFMRIRAADTGEMAGSDDPRFEDAGGPGFAATVTVYRLTNGQRFAYQATARWSEYKPEANDFMWRKMPHTMLGKCAEALALRKGFPRQLAGLYAKEEMDQAEASSAGPSATVAGSSPVATRSASPALPEKRENPAAATGETRGTPQIDTTTGEELPPGFALIDEVKPDGNWWHIVWGRDVQGGSRIFKTKIAKIANLAKIAFEDGAPVRLHAKKFPFLDEVERLLDDGMTAEELAATKWHDDEPPF
jgi:phage recombination protein Bet